VLNHYRIVLDGPQDAIEIEAPPASGARHEEQHP